MVHACTEAIVVRNGLVDGPVTAGYGLGCPIGRRICERFGWNFTLALADAVAVARVRGVATP